MYSCEADCDRNKLGVNDGTTDPKGMLSNVEETFPGLVGFRPYPKEEVTAKKVPFFLDSMSTRINNTISNEIYNRLE